MPQSHSEVQAASWLVESWIVVCGDGNHGGQLEVRNRSLTIMPLACPFEICRVALTAQLSVIVKQFKITDMRFLACLMQGGLWCRLICFAQPGGLGGFLGATCSGRRSPSILKGPEKASLSASK
ncbi:unnamed protein product [Polarella glacialis]|uniref:Uncharacterized protein n=1 Tax=Polarella glacialis TaxID=89957 RepID=A0A813JQX4_POLGL|nr:unnamed protein product [Polarella glacialis]